MQSKQGASPDPECSTQHINNFSFLLWLHCGGRLGKGVPALLACMRLTLLDAVLLQGAETVRRLMPGVFIVAES
jgi:hypothetical protein